MRIIVIRHGETNHNVSRTMQGTLDEPLNPNGIQQAQNVGEALSKIEKIDGVYSSNLVRARRTAEEIAKKNKNLKVGIIPEMRERFMGPLQGMQLQAALAKMKREGKNSFTEYGETQEELEQRLSNGWDILQQKAKENGQETIVVVSHGAALKALFSHLIDSGKVNFADDSVKQTFTDHPRLSNCSVTIVDNGKLLTYGKELVAAEVQPSQLV